MRRTGRLASTAGPARRSGLAPVGKAAKRRAPALAAAYAAVDERSGGMCEAKIAVVCTGMALDHHHVGKRSVWPELVCEPDNIVHVCRACHTEIDSDQAAAERLGLHMSRTVDNERRYGIRG